jgi:hypothetical protein
VIATIIDVCIALRMWVARSGADVVSLRTDFERGDDKLQRATRREFSGQDYAPDALGEIRDQAGDDYWALASRSRPAALTVGSTISQPS